MQIYISKEYSQTRRIVGAWKDTFGNDCGKIMTEESICGMIESLFGPD